MNGEKVCINSYAHVLEVFKEQHFLYEGEVKGWSKKNK